jgi:hypothetical protein
MAAWVPWRLSLADALKERLKRAVDAQERSWHDLLHDLAVDLAVFRHGLLDSGKFGLLLLVADGDATVTPRLLSLAYGGVVDVAAQHQGTLQYPRLFSGRLELVPECLAYCLLFHTLPFCLTGGEVALIGAFAAYGRLGFHPHGYSQGAYAGLC